MTNKRLRLAAVSAAATLLCGAVTAGIENSAVNDADVSSVQQHGVNGSANHGGPALPPGVSAPLIMNRPSPVIPNRPTGPGPVTPNGGPFHFDPESGPMFPTPGAGTNGGGGGVVPVPLPSPAGLVATGLLGAVAIRRRRVMR